MESRNEQLKSLTSQKNNFREITKRDFRFANFDSHLIPPDAFERFSTAENKSTFSYIHVKVTQPSQSMREDKFSGKA